jgi:hypothetical protein
MDAMDTMDGRQTEDKHLTDVCGGRHTAFSACGARCAPYGRYFRARERDHGITDGVAIMRLLRRTTFLAFLAFTALSLLAACHHRLYRPQYHGPFHVCLLLTDAPSASMEVVFQTLSPRAQSEVHFDTTPHGKDPAAYPHRATGVSETIDGLKDGRCFHHVRLTGLTPGTAYHFIVGDPATGYSEPRVFRTLPEGREPIRFVEGGDMSEGKTEAALLKQAAAKSPMFAVLGGDLAYDNGDLRNIDRWDRWFDNWTRNMITPDGFTVPMLAAIGNHEVNPLGAHSNIKDRAPVFLAVFGSQNKNVPYFTRRIGKDVAFIVLDTDHLTPYAGEQTQWLGKQLEALEEVPVKFAVYHKPLYPGHREFNGDGALEGRENWMPLFEKYHLTTAFEHHDHVFKRTKPLRNDKVDPKGILYLGDGCFGQKPRTVDGKPRWYIERAEGRAHFWLVEVGPDTIHYSAIGVEGGVFDECAQPRTSN